MDIPKGRKKQDLVYKNTPQRDLMLTYLPPITEKFEKAPVYFIIPGGGWAVETRQSMIDFSEKSVDRLRNEGFAVVSIDYRVSQEGAVMREIIGDCFDAARYIAHYSDELGVDSNAFYVSGHSAGGHLALMVSYAPQEMFADGYEFSDKFFVKAVAPMSPPAILYDTTTHNLHGEINKAFAGCNTKEEKEETSPITYVSKNCPPTLLMAGTSDYLVFGNSSERLYKKLKEADVCCELKLSVGGGHCFEKIYDMAEPSISMEEMQNEIASFILKQIRKEKCYDIQT